LTRLENLAAWLMLLTGWRRYMAVFIAGLASSLAMAPFDLFFVFFITLPVLVWAMDGAYADGDSRFSAKITGAFLIGWWFGFGYFLSGLWWIGNAFLVEAEDFAWALPIAVTALPAGLALFWGAATVFARALWSDHWSRVLALTLALGLGEYARSVLFTGFPWNAIGQAAMINAPTMQSAALVGQNAVMLFAIMVFAMPLTVLAMVHLPRKTRIRLLILPVLIAIVHLGYGYFRLSQNETRYAENVHLRLVQPNIDQGSKFDPDTEAELMATYFSLSKGKGPGELADVNFLIWPESAFPFLLTERRDVLSDIGNMLPPNTQLITGALRTEPGSAGNPYGHVYNSIYLISDNGEIIEAADKVHLVPFGEYLPFQSTLEAFGLEQLTRIRGGFESASERKLLNGKVGGPFAPLICYEVIFSGETGPSLEADMLGQERPRWIVNLTNDGWFGVTPGPHQHFRQAVIRGVEEGLPLVRVANTGISGVSDAYGRVLQKLALGEKGIIDSGLPLPAETTFYARHRDVPLYAVLIFLFAAIVGYRLFSRQ